MPRRRQGVRPTGMDGYMTPSAYRNSVLARVCAPATAFALAVGSASLLRSAVEALVYKKGLLETIMKIMNSLVYPLLIMIPALVVRTGRLDLVQAACISSHLLRSAAVWCTGLGLVPLPEIAKPLFELRLELVLEIALAFQDQMSLPIMAVLHGLRQAGYAASVMRWMGHDFLSALLRAVFNWVLLMLLSWWFEMRIRSGYERQLRQQQQPAQPCAAAPAQLPVHNTEFVSSLPSPVKAQDAGGSSYRASKAERLHASRVRPASLDTPRGMLDSLPFSEAAQAVSGPHSIAGSLSDSAGEGKAEPCAWDTAGHHSECTADSYDELYGRHSTVDGRASLIVEAPRVPASAFLDRVNQSACAADGGDELHGSNAVESVAARVMERTEMPASTSLTTAVAASVAASVTGTAGSIVPCSLLGPDGCGLHDPRSPQALVHLINYQRILTYTSNRQLAASMMSVKVKDLELEQLPADLPWQLQRQLKHCMPGVAMAGLALRSGCVMLTIDLLNLGDGSMAGGAEAMRLVMAQLMQSTAMDRGLEDGSTMHIQSPDELMLCQWNAASGTYMPAPEPAADALDPASLAAYGLIGTLPAVMCLGDCPPTADGTATHQLTLTVELELPSNCTLHGWQPDGELGAVEVSQEDGAVMHAMLLARQLDGGYLPVVLGQLLYQHADMSITKHTSVQVAVTLDGVVPAALNLELWCKQHAAGAAIELLVSHMPVLVLPGGSKEAAAELQQHVTDMGGVQPYRALPFEGHTLTSDPSEDAASSLLHDLGLYLTHRRRLAMAPQADTPYALPEAAMSQLGADLLVYAVRQGLGAVAGMIVDTMRQAEQPGGAVLSSGPPPKAEWLLLAAGCQPSGMHDKQTSLLHAAMASGNRSILEMVLRWGPLYGGPWWAWPWELEDAKGCTALHVAAAQPASTCIGLLDTLTSTLPAAQIQAARSAWLHCSGSANITPVELFARGSKGPTLGAMWHNQAAASTSASGPSAAGSASTTSVPASSLPLQARTGINDQSWLGSMVEAWTMHNTQDYRAWAQRQMSGLVRSWVSTLLFITALALYRSVMAGCKLYEIPHLLLHHIAYIPMAAATRGATWLGDWQSWMVAVHAFQAMAYLAKLYVPKGFAFAWTVSAHTTADAIYVVLLTAILDQSPLPLLAIAQACVAYCHGLAYASAGVPHPMLRGYIVHGLALVVTNMARARQLRAYRRWQAAQESNKQAAARAQAEKKAKTE